MVRFGAPCRLELQAALALDLLRRALEKVAVHLEHVPHASGRALADAAHVAAEAEVGPAQELRRVVRVLVPKGEPAQGALRARTARAALLEAAAHGGLAVVAGHGAAEVVRLARGGAVVAELGIDPARPMLVRAAPLRALPLADGLGQRGFPLVDVAHCVLVADGARLAAMPPGRSRAVPWGSRRQRRRRSVLLQPQPRCVYLLQQLPRRHEAARHLLGVRRWIRRRPDPE
mmetsp:Transcript_23889/g.61335  ORF Transcript_23889/g.61335 Transcript_23889/m.61335 type:complete len:231 (-) Transcript_23889:254-946(-)